MQTNGASVPVIAREAKRQARTRRDFAFHGNADADISGENAEYAPNGRARTRYPPGSDGATTAPVPALTAHAERRQSINWPPLTSMICPVT
ncbi:hypothetical protein PBR20603_04798 [Pandoraea bronchicola]|uniref:Uncharacterized protein n=1 Tax=Pandoraea bronchicola TaxID=2508287 RepID=A0A5E5BZ92_9BURK|nr:hypothetical protein PBR20603_04798 [Pandoraea bronchicola]